MTSRTSRYIQLFISAWLFVLMVIFMASAGCEPNTVSNVSEVSPEEGPVPFEVLKAVPGPPVPGGQQDVATCEFKMSNIDMDSVNTTEGLNGLELIIDNPRHFTTYLTCADTVAVDFENEFILAGISSSQPNFPYVEDQAVRFSNDTLHYEVSLLMGDATQPGSAEYIVKVLSKDYLEYPVSYNVYWREDIPPEEPTTLAGTSWKLTSIEAIDDSVFQQYENGIWEVPDDQTYVITFNEEGVFNYQVALNYEACNECWGEYERVVKDSLSISVMCVLDVFCGKEDQELQQRLRTTKTFVKKDSKLQLHYNLPDLMKGILHFERTEPEE